MLQPPIQLSSSVDFPVMPAFGADSMPEEPPATVQHHGPAPLPGERPIEDPKSLDDCEVIALDEPPPPPSFRISTLWELPSQIHEILQLQDEITELREISKSFSEMKYGAYASKRSSKLALQKSEELEKFTASATQAIDGLQKEIQRLHEQAIERGIYSFDPGQYLSEYLGRKFDVFCRRGIDADREIAARECLAFYEKLLSGLRRPEMDADRENTAKEDPAAYEKLLGEEWKAKLTLDNFCETIRPTANPLPEDLRGAEASLPSRRLFRRGFEHLRNLVGTLFGQISPMIDRSGEGLHRLWTALREKLHRLNPLSSSPLMPSPSVAEKIQQNQNQERMCELDFWYEDRMQILRRLEHDKKDIGELPASSLRLPLASIRRRLDFYREEIRVTHEKWNKLSEENDKLWETVANELKQLRIEVRQLEEKKGTTGLSLAETEKLEHLALRLELVEEEHFQVYVQTSQTYCGENNTPAVFGRSKNPEVKKIEEEVLEKYGVRVMFGDSLPLAKMTQEICDRRKSYGHALPSAIFYSAKKPEEENRGYMCNVYDWSDINYVYVAIDPTPTACEPDDLAPLVPIASIASPALEMRPSSISSNFGNLLHEIGHCNDSNLSCGPQISESAKKIARWLNEIKANDARFSDLIHKTCPGVIRSQSAHSRLSLFPWLKGFLFRHANFLVPSPPQQICPAEVGQLLTEAQRAGIPIPEPLNTTFQEYSEGKFTDAQAVFNALHEVVYYPPTGAGNETAEERLQQDILQLEKNIEKGDATAIFNAIIDSLCMVNGSAMLRRLFEEGWPAIYDGLSEEDRALLKVSIYAFTGPDEAKAETYHYLDKMGADGEVDPKLLESYFASGGVKFPWHLTPDE
jgi:hypothetical protein